MTDEITENKISKITNQEISNANSKINLDKLDENSSFQLCFYYFLFH
jgi:hypothetical protein